MTALPTSGSHHQAPVKLGKNWVPSCVVLSEQKLEFYKDAKDLTTSLKSGNSECIDLWGEIIEWTSEKSSRKNVFQVREDIFSSSGFSLCKSVGETRSESWLCVYLCDGLYDVSVLEVFLMKVSREGEP
ncbi:uncharacterized protein LOC143925692 [Lithobates pipiens]